MTDGHRFWISFEYQIVIIGGLESVNVVAFFFRNIWYINGSIGKCWSDVIVFSLYEYSNHGFWPAGIWLPLWWLHENTLRHVIAMLAHLWYSKISSNLAQIFLWLEQLRTMIVFQSTTPTINHPLWSWHKGNYVWASWYAQVMFLALSIVWWSAPW